MDLSGKSKFSIIPKILFLQIFIFYGCVDQDITGVYAHNEFYLELKNNHFIYYNYLSIPHFHNTAKEILVDSGSFQLKKNLITLHRINHQIINIKIINEETLLFQNKFFDINSGDTLHCVEKYYKNGRTRWTEGGQPELRVRTFYFNREGYSIKKEVYYDKKRKIIKVENW